ncbi:toxin secretion, membrane fusion protein [Nostoc sp. CENA543]|uniref:toxin secretion, membrane fusion protein n=1 Tax=Nostoc sp. CENA543 TaxID=1869241 RepID=UPI000CA0D797|nr:toxin secretion, membrane fusion protein [Nostoc sp. CENA543]AUT00053.1 toxin secretion, membrane fusion protein [Nostoc sp. CENA543]
MEIFYRKVNLKEQKSDFAYWQTQPYQARLEALEEIRQQFHKWKYNNAEPRLQRVYTISQR